MKSLYNYLLAIQLNVINIDVKLENFQKKIMANIQELTEALSKNTAAVSIPNRD